MNLTHCNIVVGMVLALCMASTSLVAQNNNDFKRQLQIGVGGGPIFSEIDFVTTVPQNTTKGFTAGIAAKFLSEKHLGIIAELNYTQRGWTEDFSETDFVEHAFSHTLNYLELPLMTHIYFGRRVKFIINLGPQISYLFSSSMSMNDALSDYLHNILDEEPDNPIGIRYRSADNKFDYGLLGGAGMEFDTGIGSFALEARYYFGLGDAYDNSRKKAGNFSR